MNDNDTKHPGPSLPPASKRTPSPGTTDDESVTAKTSRIVGPSRPSIQSKSDIEQEPEDSDESSDDDFGPQLPPFGAPKSGPSKYETESRPPPRAHDGDTENLTTKKRQRDDWMLVPPENTSWTSGPNSASLTNRKFMSGKSTRGGRSTDGAGSVWTEDPAQKRQRLENELLGISSESSARSGGSRDLSARSNSATADKVKSLTVSSYSLSVCPFVDLTLKRPRVVSRPCMRVTKRIFKSPRKTIPASEHSTTRRMSLERPVYQAEHVRSY